MKDTVDSPRTSNGSTSTEKTASETKLPASTRIYVESHNGHHLRVPFREIALAPSKAIDGTLEENAPVRVYDTSGPWTDADQKHDVRDGLPPEAALRALTIDAAAITGTADRLGSIERGKIARSREYHLDAVAGRKIGQLLNEQSRFQLWQAGRNGLADASAPKIRSG